MIDVKSTRSDTPDADPAQPYRQERAKKSKAVLGFGALLVSVVAYFKMFFGSPAEAGPAPADPLSEDGAGGMAPEMAMAPPPAGAAEEPSKPEPDDPSGPEFQLPLEPETINYFGAAAVRAPSFLQPGAFVPEAANSSAPLRSAQIVPFSAVDSGVVPNVAPPLAPPSVTASDPDDTDPPDPADKPERTNRAPIVTGPVVLNDVTGCAVLMVGLAQLLAGSSDPDGDQLDITNVSVSSGNVHHGADGWSFSGFGEPGPVVITYQITDGALSVQQVARFNVVEANTIIGTEGNDILAGTACVDMIDGRGGDDIVSAAGGDDEVLGGAGNDHLDGGDGDDAIRGDGGDDVVFGGDGADRLSGGAGNDRIFGEAGNDLLFGDAGNDLLIGGGGDDFIDGGDGDDRAMGGDGDDAMIGGAGADRLEGGVGDDTLAGGAGDDWLDGGTGADVVAGGDGDDRIVAAADGAADRLDGGAGIDTADYSAATGDLVIDLVAGTASGGGMGQDILTAFERIIAGEGNDHLRFGDGSFSLFGAGGDDLFELAAPGAAGDLRDTVHRILDFEVGDVLRVHGFDISSQQGPGTDGARDWIYGTPGTEETGPLRFRDEWIEARDWTIVQADLDDDTHFETAIHLHGRHDLTVVEVA